jgi:hypothetical protein
VGTRCWERTESRGEEPPIVVLEKPKEERSDQSPTAGERSNSTPVVSAIHTAHCDLAQPNCVCTTWKHHCRMATTCELGQHRNLLGTAAVSPTAPRFCVGVSNEEESPERERLPPTPGCSVRDCRQPALEARTVEGSKDTSWWRVGSGRGLGEIHAPHRSEESTLVVGARSCSDRVTGC